MGQRAKVASERAKDPEKKKDLSQQVKSIKILSIKTKKVNKNI